MTDLDRLERDLIESGDRWRGSQAPPPPITAVWRRPSASWRGRSGVLVLAATMVVALGAISVGGGGRPHASPSEVPSNLSNVSIAWDAAQIRSEALDVGDAVVADGIVMVKSGDPAKLCAGAFDMLMFGVPPSCGSPDVPIAGSVDIAALPGAQVVADTSFTSTVRVTGRWTGSAIADPVFTPAPAPDDRVQLPCSAPTDGWSSLPPLGGFRAALNPLAAEVSAHPELYAGYLTVSVIPGQPVPAVEVVRTKVDPRDVAARVASLFPYAICLTADYSQADIDAAMSAFAYGQGSTTVPEVIGDTHRVGVHIAVVDDAALALFLAHPAAYPIPLVTKVAATSEPTEPAVLPTPAPTIGAQASPSSFELPSEIDGQPVLVGDAASAALGSSTDTTPILIGGWLKPYTFMSCPVMLSFPPVWNICSAIHLYLAPWSSGALAVYQPGSPADLPTVPAWLVQPVVLRVHTHDPGCPTIDDCASLAVLDGVAWLGRADVPPTPTNTAPPNGISQATAEALAVGAAKTRWQSVFPVRAVSARAGRYGEVGPPGSTDVEADRWVWAVVVTEGLLYPDCASNVVPCNDVGGARSLVVLDYVTGEVLIQETPAPSG
ncbi:MAG TPA: hypothetical protein VGI98_05760 [Candidatus Limnocylindrales bacterium]